MALSLTPLFWYSIHHCWCQFALPIKSGSSFYFCFPCLWVLSSRYILLWNTTFRLGNRIKLSHQCSFASHYLPTSFCAFLCAVEKVSPFIIKVRIILICFSEWCFLCFLRVSSCRFVSLLISLLLFFPVHWFLFFSIMSWHSSSFLFTWFCWKVFIRPVSIFF